MHTPSRYAVAGASAVAVMALSSCGLLPGQAPPPEPPEPDDIPEVEDVDDQAEEAEPEGGGEAADFPAEGTELAIGQGASFPFDYGDSSGEIEMTVTEIEEGSAADLDVLDLGDEAAGMTPYYIRTTITNVGDTELSFVSPNSLKGVLPDGGHATDVSIIGDFAPCPNESSPSDFTNGDSYEACDVVLVNEAQEIAGAQYWGEPYGLMDGEGLYWML
jgi:hypothetical protein